MKKYIALVLAIICVLSLVGCASESSGTTPSEHKNFVEFSVDYTLNDDGTYTCRGNNFKYKLDVSGVDGEAQVTYIVLTNDPEISFEEVFYSMIKAEISTGVPEFVILGWYY